MIIGTGISLWRYLAQSQVDSQTHAGRRIICLFICVYGCMHKLFVKNVQSCLISLYNHCFLFLAINIVVDSALLKQAHRCMQYIKHNPSMPAGFHLPTERC